MESCMKLGTVVMSMTEVLGVLLQGDDVDDASRISSEWSHDFDDDVSSAQSGSVRQAGDARFQTIGMLYDQNSETSSDRSEHMKCEAMSLPSTISGTWVDPRTTKEHREHMKQRDTSSKSDVGSDQSSGTDSYVSGNTLVSENTVIQNVSISSSRTGEHSDTTVGGTDAMQNVDDVKEANESSNAVSAGGIEVAINNKKNRNKFSENRSQFSWSVSSSETVSSESNSQSQPPVEHPPVLSIQEQLSEISSPSDFTRDFLSQGDLVSERDEFGELVSSSNRNLEDWELLIIAAETNNLKEVEALLENDDIDINRSEEDGCGVLFVASQHNHYEIVRLLSNREDIDMFKVGELKGRDGRENPNTPFSIACEQGCVEVVKVFLENSRTDVNQSQTGWSWTPLIGACDQNQPEVVQLLLNHPDIKVNQADANGMTPLSIASGLGHSQVVQKLFRHPDVNVNQADKNDSSPLMLACWRAHVEIVRQLLSHSKINVNQFDVDGVTALYRACRNGQSDIVQMLLNHDKINVNQLCTTRSRKTFPVVSQPVARYYDDGNECVTIGFDADNVLVVAMIYHEPVPIKWEDDCYKFILGSGFILTAKAQPKEFEDSKTIPDEIVWTIENGTEYIWRSASIGRPRNAFLAACQNGHTEIVKLLLARKDIIVNKKFTDGSTALKMAIRLGHDGVAQVLQEYYEEMKKTNKDRKKCTIM